MKIFKWELPTIDANRRPFGWEWKIPAMGGLLSTGVQYGGIVVWGAATEKAAGERRVFGIETGKDFDGFPPAKKGEPQKLMAFIGTVQLDLGRYVLHIWTEVA